MMTRTTRRVAFASLLACAAGLAACLAPEASVAQRAPAAGEPAKAAKQPDIVLFITDDLTRSDVGAYGSLDAKTPNIDRLAKEGTRFTNAFAASPSCSPSRSSIFTGDYPMRHGGHANHSPIRADLSTLPERLQKLGYRVVIAGKTHIGPRRSFPFEYFAASVDRPPRGQGVLYSELNVDAIDQLLASRDRDKPLALIVATFAPHVPWARLEGYDPAKLHVPPSQVDTPETRDARARYLTRVTQADTQLGAVRASLAKHGDPSNTLLLFTADQGAQFPFSKWTLYDAAIAAPLIAYWPGHVPAGRVNDAMISLVDLLPTMQAAAGATPSTDMDGRSFLDVLVGRKDSFHDAVFAAHSGVPEVRPGSNIAPMRAIRTKDYKLIVNYRTDIKYVSGVSNAGGEGGYWQSWVQRAQTDRDAAAKIQKFHYRQPVELYDMRNDPYELKNLANDPSKAALIASMRKRLEAWMVQQGEDPKNVALPSAARRGGYPYAQ